MSINVARILADPDRGWHAAEPATEPAVEAFRKGCRYQVPEVLFAFWRFSNGGECNDLALPPMRFALDRVEDATVALAGDFETKEFPDLVFFGGNGGLERIALDYRASADPSVVMVDPIAGLESAEKIADTVEDLILAIGLPYEEEA
jgi:hypothetical protein